MTRKRNSSESKAKWDEPVKSVPLAEIKMLVGSSRKEGESIEEWLDRLHKLGRTKSEES